METDHLMTIKHAKSRAIPYTEAPVLAPIPTSRARKVREESSDEEEIGFVPHNRGNKLKRKPNPTTGGCRLHIPDLRGINSNYSNNNNPKSLDDNTNEEEIRSNFRRSLAASGVVVGTGPGPGSGLGAGAGTSSIMNGILGTTIQPGSKLAAAISKREVIQIRPTSSSSYGVDENGHAEDALSDDENPYAGIKINELLSPLESSTEILQRPQLRKIFQSPQLQIMAVHAMAMIEREKAVNKMMSRVALILQGDDPLYPQLGYGMGEGCSTALRGMPDQAEFINGNKEWKKNGEDREQVQKTLSLLMENINCSNQYIDLLNESRDAVNHVSKQKKRLWKKLKEKRERMRRRMHPKTTRDH
ncbi:RXT2-like protein [Lobosporangium transversale]|uniref:RXT2-like protein n=1 Tax=Lobosporangium transversale TaxID=64571 RepID=A0A1Y2GB31_9FUNG|nr:RXT2-like protein [Lobosporangium transversale]ORZ05933.1 RXT2-like protein [Lobosporangium transversale]|eukprot:XP_021877314.1 RXT2-like protein [Lobosporangium transversale]